MHSALASDEKDVAWKFQAPKWNVCVDVRRRIDDDDVYDSNMYIIILQDLVHMCSTCGTTNRLNDRKKSCIQFLPMLSMADVRLTRLCIMITPRPQRNKNAFSGAAACRIYPSPCHARPIWIRFSHLLCLSLIFIWMFKKHCEIRAFPTN